MHIAATDPFRVTCPRRVGRGLPVGWAAALLAGACLAATAAWADPPHVVIHGASGDSGEPVLLPPGEVTFLPYPGEPGVFFARPVGDNAAPGLYVTLVRMEKDAVIPPHRHPDGRITTVISGSLRYGVGEKADPASAKVVGPGGLYYTPPNTPHFIMATEGPVSYQEVGMGPTATVPVK